MASERRLTVEAGLVLGGSHLLVAELVLPWLARWLPALALNETETSYVPSFRALRVTPVGADLTDPGLWAYLGLVWLCFGGWVALRREALRNRGRELLAEADLEP